MGGAAGDSQALPGYVSLYLQVTDPKSSRWDCFASYRLAVVHQAEEAKSIARESWHRFSSRVARPTAVARPASSSHGWADFAPVATIADPRQARPGHRMLFWGPWPGLGDRLDVGLGPATAACGRAPSGHGWPDFAPVATIADVRHVTAVDLFVLGLCRELTTV